VTQGRLAVVADVRDHYDDRAMELARAGTAAGWQVEVLLIAFGSRQAQLDGEDGIRVTRVGADGTVPTPRAVELRVLDDRVAVLTARRVALDRGGESRRSVRRTAIRAALRKARSTRDEPGRRRTKPGRSRRRSRGRAGPAQRSGCATPCAG